MSLRDTLRAMVVARCTPQAMQHATSAPERATGHATGAQLRAALRSRGGATANATAVQLPSCTPPATTQQLRPKSCLSCRHRSRVGTCRAPAAAGLTPAFEIVWPEPAHGTRCAAWSLSPAEATVAVLTAAGRGGWSNEVMHAWLRDADENPRVVLDALRSRGPTP